MQVIFQFELLPKYSVIYTDAIVKHIRSINFASGLDILILTAAFI